MFNGKKYYEILGLQPGASKDEVKKAYRDLAKKHHPDKGGSEERFKEISEAYNVLTKKSESPNFHSGEFHGMNIEDLFKRYYNNQQEKTTKHYVKKKGRPRPIENADIKVNSSVSLDQILKGAKSAISVLKKKYCEDCEGKGGKKVEECKECLGGGQIIFSSGDMFFATNRLVPCTGCGTRGIIIEDECNTCHGDGVISYREEYMVEIKGEKKE